MKYRNDDGQSVRVPTQTPTDAPRIVYALAADAARKVFALNGVGVGNAGTADTRRAENV